MDRWGYFENIWGINRQINFSFDFILSSAWYFFPGAVNYLRISNRLCYVYNKKLVMSYQLSNSFLQQNSSFLIFLTLHFISSLSFSFFEKAFFYFYWTLIFRRKNTFLNTVIYGWIYILRLPLTGDLKNYFGICVFCSKYLYLLD